MADLLKLVRQLHIPVLAEPLLKSAVTLYDAVP